MKRLSDSARVAMMFNPLRASSRQSAGGGSRRINVSRLPAIDLIGASELFISWPITRTSRCQALRSSSRSVRLRSVRTSSSCGRPRSRKELRRTPHRPEPPGKRERQRRVFVCVADRLSSPRSLRSPAEQFVHRLSEQIFAGAIDQPQSPFGIEGENGDVDFRHDRAQQARSLRTRRAAANGAFRPAH